MNLNGNFGVQVGLKCQNTLHFLLKLSPFKDLYYLSPGGRCQNSGKNMVFPVIL
jgi:hypothetical protein